MSIVYLMEYIDILLEFFIMPLGFGWLAQVLVMNFILKLFKL